MRILVLLSMCVFSSCALWEHDVAEMKFPHCKHHLLYVFNKCAEMNYAGEHVTSIQVEEMFKAGKIQPANTN